MIGSKVKMEALRHRVTIQQPVYAADDIGGQEKTWQDVVTVWAAIEPLNGAELLKAEKRTMQISHRITIRHQSGLTANMRCMFESRYFYIQAIVNPKESDEMLILLVQE